ncbi:MAG: helix-turn-helix domain-containing protein [Pacificimonas sp.]
MAEDADAYAARRLASARRAARLTNADLARDLGVSAEQVRKYEKGTNRITVARLVALANVLEKPVDWFLPPETETALREPQASYVAATDGQTDRLLRAFQSLPKDKREPLIDEIEERAENI